MAAFLEGLINIMAVSLLSAGGYVGMCLLIASLK